MPSSAAARTARWRQRRNDGRRVLVIEVTDNLVDLLIAEGLLAEWDRDNRELVTAAVQKMHDVRIWEAQQKGKI